MWSPNHWTAKEFPEIKFLIGLLFLYFELFQVVDTIVFYYIHVSTDCGDEHIYAMNKKISKIIPYNIKMNYSNQGAIKGTKLFLWNV